MAKLDSAIVGVPTLNSALKTCRLCHSSQFPNCLQEAVEKNRVGIVGGRWVMCLVLILPVVSVHGANLCFVDLGVEWGK